MVHRPRLEASLFHSYKGLSWARSKKGEKWRFPKGRIQREWELSNVGYTHRGTREARQRSLCVRNIRGYLARKTPLRTCLYQGLSFLFRPMCEGGKGGTLTVRTRSSPSNQIQILWERVEMWMSLSHENILPFHGADIAHFKLALVYDWAENGNVNQYVSSHPHVSRSSLVRESFTVITKDSC